MKRGATDIRHFLPQPLKKLCSQDYISSVWRLFGIKGLNILIHVDIIALSSTCKFLRSLLKKERGHAYEQLKEWVEASLTWETFDTKEVHKVEAKLQFVKEVMWSTWNEPLILFCSNSENSPLRRLFKMWGDQRGPRQYAIGYLIGREVGEDIVKYWRTLGFLIFTPRNHKVWNQANFVTIPFCCEI